MKNKLSRKKEQKKKSGKKKVVTDFSKETAQFAAWPLGVKGKLTREEIYDYL